MSLQGHRFGLGTSGSWSLTWCLACHNCSVASKVKVISSTEQDWLFFLTLSLFSPFPSPPISSCLSDCLSVSFSLETVLLYSQASLKLMQSSCLGSEITSVPSTLPFISLLIMSCSEGLFRGRQPCMPHGNCGCPPLSSSLTFRRHSSVFSLVHMNLNLIPKPVSLADVEVNYTV